MCRVFTFLVLISLLLLTSAAWANLDSRSLTPKPFGSALQAVPQPSIENVVDRAHELLGTPYKWGGATQAQGFDCSGLLVYLFKTEANLQLPRTTGAMQRSSAATIKRGALKPGDAVFFKGNGRQQINHVGLYVGEGKFIHSPRTGKNTRIDSLTNSYWKKNFTFGKRFHAVR